MAYGQGNGSTGWMSRLAWTPGQFVAGGLWSNGGQARETSNFAVGGDVILTDAGNSTDPALSVFSHGRNLEGGSHSAWNARLDVVPDAQNQLSGGYTLGPRWADGQLRAALSLGPGLRFTNTSNANSVSIDVPAVNVAAEYELREWFVLRGSAVGGLVLDVTDISKFSDTRTFQSVAGGLLGVGFKHKDKAQFDMSVNPGWAVQGPAILSGVGSPMFATVSGRFAI